LATQLLRKRLDAGLN